MSWRADHAADRPWFFGDSGPAGLLEPVNRRLGRGKEKPSKT